MLMGMTEVSDSFALANSQRSEALLVEFQLRMTLFNRVQMRIPVGWW